MTTRNQYLERMQTVIEKGVYLSSEKGLALELIEIVVSYLEQENQDEKKRKVVAFYLSILTEGERVEPLMEEFKKKIHGKRKI
jgi:hypothetical protein